MDDLSQNPYSAFFAPGSPQASVSNALGSNPYAQFFGGSSSTAQSQAAQAVVVQPQAPQTGVAAQWASAGPMDRLKMLGQNFMPTAEKVVPPIAKDFAAQGINTLGTAAGATLGAPFGPLGAGAGAALGNAGAQAANVGMGLQPKFMPGQVAGAAIAPMGTGPITAPLAGAAGVLAQSAIDNQSLPSAAQVALAAIGGRLASGEAGPAAATGSREATLAEGTQAGYVIPPNETNPSLVNRAGASLAGKADLKTAAIEKNQATTNALAARALGLTPGDVNPDGSIPATAIEGVKAQAAQTYAAVGALSPEAAYALDQLKQAQFTTKQLYSYYAANKNPEILAKAQKSSQDVEAAENLLEQEATKAGQPDLIGALQQARITYAKANVVDSALNKATGNVSAPTIGAMFDKNKPLTEELGTIGKFNQAFPVYTGEIEGRSAPGVSKLGLAEAAGLGYMGAEKFGPAGALLGLTPFADKAARTAMLSGPYQSMMAQAPNTIPAGIAQNLARFSAQNPALTPDLSLLQQTQ